MKALNLLCALALAAAPLVSAPAFAMSDNSSKKCKAGEKWDAKTKSCVKQNSQDTLYEKGRELAHSGRYQEAIDVLMTADRNDERVLNYLGYANRKLGRLDTGLAYYQAAIAIDPEYTLVREYLGEALLQKNDLDGALEQLAVIRDLCSSRACEEYQELSGHIATYIRKNAS